MRHEIKYQYVLGAVAVQQTLDGWQWLTNIVTTHEPYWASSQPEAQIEAMTMALKKWPGGEYTRHEGVAAPTGVERHTVYIGWFYLTWLEEKEAKRETPS